MLEGSHSRGGSSPGAVPSSQGCVLHNTGTATTDLDYVVADTAALEVEDEASETAAV